MTKLHESYLSCKKKHGSEVARDLLLVTYHQCGEIKRTAREWRCSKNTVKLALQKKHTGSLKDTSRAPWNQPYQTPKAIEGQICRLRKDTGLGKCRLHDELLRNYGLDIPESTIGKIVSRNHLPAKTYKAAWRRKTRRYYDRHNLLPFERNEIDVKEIADKKALPSALYNRFQQGLMPAYQWTWFEVTSRMRFVAYFYEDSWTNGQIFFRIVTAWLRMFGITGKINCSIDGGTEWHATVESSFAKSVLNFYQPLGLNMSLIRKGHPEDNPFVERSHRTDDEECYVPLGKYLRGELSFLKVTQWWNLHYNTRRPHQGINRKTPLELMRQKRPGINPAIANFPPIILDPHAANFFLKRGQNVFDYYQNGEVTAV